MNTFIIIGLLGGAFITITFNMSLKITIIIIIMNINLINFLI